MGERMQGVPRPWALVLGVCALAVLAVLPSAAAKSQPARETARVADLSTVPAIKSYLRSVGVDTKGLVVQRGARNYAGPNCPGPKWNCTRSTKVVQVSTRAAANNRFVCRRTQGSGSQTTDSTLPDLSCVIVQGASASNSATCDIATSTNTPLVSQTCLITQGGSSNTAVARLDAVLDGTGGDQNVSQRIEILQTGGASGNTLTATQTAWLRYGTGALNVGGADVSSGQDFHQVVCANQQAAGGGSNKATVAQNGRATIRLRDAGDVDIRQNTDGSASTCQPGGPAAPFADLAGEGHHATLCPVETDDFGTAKADANACSRVQQDSGTGTNTIAQSQKTLLEADVNRGGEVELAQGSADGGIDATQDQESSGVSSNADTQGAEQFASVNRVDDFDVTQIEDPRCCAGGHQLGNGGSSWSLQQSLLQRLLVDEELADLETVEGGSAVQQGANFGSCTTAGTCNVSQQLTNNAESQTNSCTGSSCDVFVDCTATGESELCTTEDDLEISNTASVSSDTPDPNLENNTATTTTLVLGEGPISSTRAVRMAAQAITPTANAGDLADAIETEAGTVTGAAFDEIPPLGTPHAVSDSALGDFPTAGTTYSILTTGNAQLADDANDSNTSGENIGGGNQRGTSDLDVTVLAIQLAVPVGRNCLSFDFRFLSEEFPEFVGSNFDDAFIAELDTSDWAPTVEGGINAPNNFAFDSLGNPITINAAGAATMTAEESAGTTYDGATPTLRASTPITDGSHTLYLSIFDQGDGFVDSAVFVDNLVLGSTAPEECEEGTEPTEAADLSVSIEDAPDPVEAGEQLTYEITVSNAGPDTAEAVTLLDELPATFTFVSATPTQGSCTQVLSMSCALGDIASGSSATVTVVVTP